jgi:hypothetical protein
MRDTADQMTADIPGVEPLPPPPPPRIPIAVRMAACGYASPLTRDDTCRHCKHLVGTLNNVGSWAKSVSHRCKLNDFPVQLGAVCNEHERMKK